MEVGIIVSGNSKEIIARKKEEVNVEIGEIVKVIDTKNNSIILFQIIDLAYASQYNDKTIEFLAGLEIEHQQKIIGYESELKNYELIKLKPLLKIKKGKDGDEVKKVKEIPSLFSKVYRINEEDLSFMPHNGIPIGRIRSGSRVLEIKARLPLKEMINHHVLITGSTGKGKSVLMKRLLWEIANSSEEIGMLVIDPHNEYYGIKGIGLKDHPNRDKIVYYSNKEHIGNSLMINLKSLKPEHLQIFDFTDAQIQLLALARKEFKEEWIKKLLLTEEEWVKELKNEKGVQETTLLVTKRKIAYLLGLEYETRNTKKIVSHSIFVTEGGDSVLAQIVKEVKEGKIVIIDTSNVTGNIELLLTNMITLEIFRKKQAEGVIGVKIGTDTKRTKSKEEINIGIVLEEAPRILNNKSNIFGTIAREGRKFGIGLIAITQMPSLIPKDLLANMNTKIILGTELGNEREAIINSSPQDIRDLSQSIASLDKGEALLTSIFSKIAIPLKIDPIRIESIKKIEEKNEEERKEYIGF